MLKQQKIFFDFLRFCIGSAKDIPGSLKEVDWKELSGLAQKQALLGQPGVEECIWKNIDLWANGSRFHFLLNSFWGWKLSSPILLYAN